MVSVNPKSGIPGDKTKYGETSVGSGGSGGSGGVGSGGSGGGNNPAVGRAMMNGNSEYIAARDKAKASLKSQLSGSAVGTRKSSTFSVRGYTYRITGEVKKSAVNDNRSNPNGTANVGPDSKKTAKTTISFNYEFVS